MTSDEVKARDKLIENCSNRLWRLNNLYAVTNKEAEHLPFRMRWAQEEIYRNMHYRNVILKCRQIGVTTFWQLFALDMCLWNSNTQIGVIADSLNNAEEIFRTKIKYAYDHLPDHIKEARPTVRNEGGQLILDNGSSIRVGVTMRSGTVQLLHVSELPKIDKNTPEKALEILAGALEAVPLTGIVAFEGTAQVRRGVFYNTVETAMANQAEGAELTPLDFKMFFFPWWREPTYTMNDANISINTEDKEYFDRLKAEHSIMLTLAQKRWYVKKKSQLGDEMYKEHPSYPEEAFYASMVGAYWRKELTAARLEHRVGKVPYDPYALVDTWWDLGVNDQNVIWFTQDVGRMVHVIDFYQNANEGLPHYLDVLKAKKYRYGRHTAPHDIRVREYSSGNTRWALAARLGLRFIVCPRIRHEDQIQAGRRMLAICAFDKEKCDEGIAGLQDYRREYDDALKVFKDKEIHDDASHIAKSFMTLAVGHDFNSASGAAGKPREIVVPSSDGWV